MRLALVALVLLCASTGHAQNEPLPISYEAARVAGVDLDVAYGDLAEAFSGTPHVVEEGVYPDGAPYVRVTLVKQEGQEHGALLFDLATGPHGVFIDGKGVRSRQDLGVGSSVADFDAVYGAAEVEDYSPVFNHNVGEGGGSASSRRPATLWRPTPESRVFSTPSSPTTTASRRTASSSRSS